MLLNPRRTRTNMKLLQLVWIFLLTLCGQSGIIAVTVKEDGEVILDCSFVGENIEKKPFSWKKDVDQSNEEVFLYSGGDPDPGPQFKGRVFHFPDQLRFGNASIKITKTKTSDSGTYTCYHASIQKDIKSTISLTVGASPKPSVELLAQTKDSALLQCEVLGAFPKPEVVWTDSSGKILHADEPKVTKREGKKYDTVLHITVTETDNYTCVATQRNISHQINSTTFVPFNEEKPNGEGFGVGTVVVTVLITAVVVGVLAFVFGRRSKSNTGGPTTDRSTGVKKIHSVLKQDNDNNTDDSAA